MVVVVVAVVVLRPTAPVTPTVPQSRPTGRKQGRREPHHVRGPARRTFKGKIADCAHRAGIQRY